MISQASQALLNDIKHPTDASDATYDYSLTIDQNMINSYIMEVIATKHLYSIRQLAGMFDNKAQYIRMLSTGFLTINMPNVVNEYGGSNQFDLVTTIDQAKFNLKNKRS